MFVTERIVAFRPLSCFDRYGNRVRALDGGVELRSPLSGTWQVAQALSSACGPPGWFAPVTQSMLSWQAPHGARAGFVYQTSDCEGFVRRVASLVAVRAVADVLREHDRREIVVATGRCR